MEMIADALLHLMEMESYSLITITWICQEALVSRNTFYRNFETKEDVLAYIIRKKVHCAIHLPEQEENIVHISNEELERLYRRYYEYWYSEREFLTVIVKQRMYVFFADEFMKSLDHYIVAQMAAQVEGNIFREYVYNCASSTLMSLLMTWVRRRFQESVEDMIRISMDIWKMEV